MNDVLQEIITYKREYVANCVRQKPLAQIKELLSQAQPAKGFANALSTKIANGKPALIAELKKASPSKGLIRADFDALKLADAYREGGAACLSVLTDEKYFAGHIDYLQQVAKQSPLPTLRKDFIIDEYQIYEARAFGADCILLIMAALSDEEAVRFESLAFSLKLDVLVEVHDEAELKRALHHLQTPLIGINNRNLKTLQVDLQTSLRLRTMIPDDKIIICESGIKTNAEVNMMRSAGINGFLVGESLMLQDDLTSATKALLGI
jgi:indole-3-glycerol phosphate synthase